MIARTLMTAALVALGCVPVCAQLPAARPTTTATGVVRYPFPGPTPRLICRPLFVCTIGLQAGESVLGIALGDSVRWIVTTAPSGPGGQTPIVLIKPKQAGLQTNLVITTTSHVYYVDMRSSSNRTNNERIGFSYPLEEKLALEAATATALKQEAAKLNEQNTALPLLPASQLDRAYKISGPRALTPSSVYNDGVHTYVGYDVVPTDLPLLVAVAADGSDQVLNYRFVDRTFIVDGIPHGLDLVLNAGTGRRGRGEQRVQIRHS